MSKSVENIFDMFLLFLTWPLSAGPCCSPLIDPLVSLGRFWYSFVFLFFYECWFGCLSVGSAVLSAAFGVSSAGFSFLGLWYGGVKNVWREENVPENALSRKFLDPSKKASGLLCRGFLYRKNRATTPEGGGKRTIRGGVQNLFLGGVSLVMFSSPLFFPPPHGVLWIPHSEQIRLSTRRALAKRFKERLVRRALASCWFRPQLTGEGRRSRLFKKKRATRERKTFWISRKASQKGPENWCRAKHVTKCRKSFDKKAIFDVFCPARKMSKSVENIFDTFWRFLTWPLSAGLFFRSADFKESLSELCLT